MDDRPDRPVRLRPEAIASGPLDEGAAALVRLSAALGAGNRGELKSALDFAAEAARSGEVEEALLQSYLLVGFPATLNAFALWRERSGRTPPPPVPDDPQTWWERGETACRAIYGDQYAPLRENVAGLHPDLDRWMIREGYGKVLSRPGLAADMRELCSVAVLVGLDAPRQLYAHLRGALRVGATPGAVDHALTIIRGVVPAEMARAARTIWDRVRSRSAGMDGSGDVR